MRQMRVRPRPERKVRVVADPALLGAPEPEPDLPVDLAVEWGATVIQPRAYSRGGTQLLVVDVCGPAILDGPVTVVLDPSRVGRVQRLSGRWQGDRGQMRRLTADLTSAIPRGVYRVAVTPKAGGQEPMLPAGVLTVR